MNTQNDDSEFVGRLESLESLRRFLSSEIDHLRKEAPTLEISDALSRIAEDLHEKIGYRLSDVAFKAKVYRNSKYGA